MGYDIWLLGIGIWHLIEDENMTVHHIVEREENPDLIFRLDNLITVSRDSHAEIHSLYNKGGKYKEEAIERIKEGIKRFEDAVND